jgi:hypothetical protein
MVFAVAAGICIHCDVEHPVQGVLDGPVRAGGGVEAGGGHRRAEQVICCFLCGFQRNIAPSGDCADGLEAGPGMGLREPADLAGDGGAAGLNPAMIGIADLGDILGAMIPVG